MKGGTIYWGKHSQRWALKAYSKGEEIEVPKHRLREALLDTPLAKWAKQQAATRTAIEEQRARETRDRNRRRLDPSTGTATVWRVCRRLDMKEQIALSTEEHLKLPQRLRGTYALWRCGEDLRSTLPKATYFRHRKAFLEYGIDIAAAGIAGSQQRGAIDPHPAGRAGQHPGMGLCAAARSSIRPIAASRGIGLSRGQIVWQDSRIRPQAGYMSRPGDAADMSGSDFAYLRHRAGFDQRAAAQFLDVSLRTIRRYEKYGAPRVAVLALAARGGEYPGWGLHVPGTANSGRHVAT
ncbi:MAG: hypothetical protein IPF57_13650 [Gammaproteobacteria bacterium]|nr:hypothetical protein [Gammaproteobacteria bacterium]